MSRLRASLLPAAAGLLAAAALAGCGDSRTGVPNFAHVANPAPFREISDSAGGVRLWVPSDWSVLKLRPPLLDVITSGPAVIALWRYARPPSSLPVALPLARQEMLRSARRRDPGLSLIRSAFIKVDGYDAVVLDTLERIGQSLRQDRSIHVYSPGAEVVLEEYAPPDLFHSVDHTVFSPVRRSLRIASGQPA